VVHKTPDPHTALTTGGERYYFHVRNTIYMLRSRSWKPREKFGLFQSYVRSVSMYLRRARFRPHALGVVARGVRDGFIPPSDPSGPYLGRSR
jgi:hypothetical protein